MTYRLEKNYDDLYMNGGFGYDRASEAEFLGLLFEPDRDRPALLDIGCGDGFWSAILHEWYVVTGIDISRVAIDVAKRRYPHCAFLHGDFLKSSFKPPYDVTFCRAPSFLNVPTESEEFMFNAGKVMAATRRRMIFIQWVKEPYGEWDEKGVLFMHEPDFVAHRLSEFGKTSVKLVSNYMVCEVLSNV